MRLIVLFLLLAGPALAETRQFGNVVYELPADWRVGAVRDGHQVILSDMPGDRCEFCYLYIGRGAPKNFEPEKFLKTQRFAFVDDEDRPSVEVLKDPEPLMIGPYNAAMMGIKADGDLQILVAIALPSRTEIIGFEGPGHDEDALAETMATFGTVVAPLLESLRFVSEGDPGLLPDPVPGPLDGLWWGWGNSWSLGLDGMMTYEIDYRRITFFPDGHFYDGTPPDGLDGLDRKALMRAGDTDFGTYRLEGGTLILSYADGAREELPGDGVTFQDGDRSLGRVEVLPDDTRLDGFVDSFFYSGFVPGGGVSGGAYSASSLRFHPDGTWDSSRSGGASGTFESGGTVTGGYAVDSGEITESGTYQIRNGLLTRTFKGSRETAVDLVFQAGDDIMIGDQVLKTE